MRARQSALALVIAITFCGGCVPIVVPVPPLGFTAKGKPINAGVIAFIRPGVSTKVDVVWELGAPDESGATAPDTPGDWVSYTSWRHRGDVAFGFLMLWPLGTAAGATYECRRPWLLKVWFDAVGVVKHHEFQEGETQCQTVP
jgi:hypothetical protein